MSPKRLIRDSRTLIRLLAGLACLLPAVLFLLHQPTESRAQAGGAKDQGNDKQPRNKFGKLTATDPKADKEEAEWEEARKKLKEQLNLLELKVIASQLASTGRGLDGILSVPRVLRAATQWTSPPEKLVGHVVASSYREGVDIYPGNGTHNRVQSRHMYFNGTKTDAQLTFDIWNNKTGKWENLWKGTVRPHALGWECYTQPVPKTYKYRSEHYWNYKFRWYMTAGKESNLSTTIISVSEVRPPLLQ